MITIIVLRLQRLDSLQGAEQKLYNRKSTAMNCPIHPTLIQLVQCKSPNLSELCWLSDAAV